MKGAAVKCIVVHFTAASFIFSDVTAIKAAVIYP